MHNPERNVNLLDNSSVRISNATGSVFIGILAGAVFRYYDRTNNSHNSS